MSGAEIQEAIALAVVALVVAAAMWHRARRKARHATGCSSCHTPAAKPKETTLRFFRRRQ